MEADVRVVKVEAVQDPDESAWITAVEAAPWVLGSREPEREDRPN